MAQLLLKKKKTPKTQKWNSEFEVLLKCDYFQGRGRHAQHKIRAASVSACEISHGWMAGLADRQTDGIDRQTDRWRGGHFVVGSFVPVVSSLLPLVARCNITNQDRLPHLSVLPLILP